LKLEKSDVKYDCTIYESLVLLVRWINTWNSLPNWVVSANNGVKWQLNDR